MIPHATCLSRIASVSPLSEHKPTDMEANDHPALVVLDGIPEFELEDHDGWPLTKGEGAFCSTI